MTLSSPQILIYFLSPYSHDEFFIKVPFPFFMRELSRDQWLSNRVYRRRHNFQNYRECRKVFKFELNFSKRTEVFFLSVYNECIINVRYVDGMFRKHIYTIRTWWCVWNKFKVIYNSVSLQYVVWLTNMFLLPVEGSDSGFITLS